MNQRRPIARASAVYVVLLGICLGAKLASSLWVLDTNGLSQSSQKLPYWDFTNLWLGGVLALKGQVADLFEIDLYRNALHTLVSPFAPNQEWSYPPSILLIGMPLALLPIFPAYLVWTMVTLLLLFCATRRLDLSLWVRLLIVMSPAAIVNVIFGQNGALTAALLMSGLLLAPLQPIGAGILLGLLTVKPQIGLLVPFCLLASGNFRTFATAAATALLLALSSALIFGWDVWLLFFSKTRPMMTAILEAPYQQGYQVNSVTSFMFARSLGLGIGWSYGVQAVFSAASLATTWWLWRPNRQIDHPARVCLTGLLTIVATPYGYVYDAIPLNIAAAFFFSKGRHPTALLCLAWIYPLINQDFVGRLPLIGIWVPTLFAASACWTIWRNERRHRLASGGGGAITVCEEPPARSDDRRPCAGSGRPAAVSEGYSGAGSAD